MEKCERCAHCFDGLSYECEALFMFSNDTKPCYKVLKGSVDFSSMPIFNFLCRESRICYELCVIYYSAFELINTIGA